MSVISAAFRGCPAVLACARSPMPLHAILIAIWHMAATGTPYRDPGPDFFTRRDPDLTKRRALNQLQQLGYTVTLTQATA